MKALMSWSGGKDSAMALHLARRDAGTEVVGLLSTLSLDFDRVSMHGVRRNLLESQARALRLPVEKVFLPTPPADMPCGIARGFTAFATNDSYEQAILEAFARAKAAGVEAIVFGDIYLEDLRQYREKLLAKAGLRGIFPLWGMPSGELVERVLDAGFGAIVVCIDSGKLPAAMCGRALNRRFIADLPAGADPCGERGEYHTFVFEGPGFHQRIAFEKGECVLRDPFWFCDLVAAQELHAVA
jgi:uncharacterized protein (TIGR00290 family)